MAFHLATAAAGANSHLLNVLQPTPAPVAARGEFPRLVVPRNDSSVPTVNMFIDSGGEPDVKYAASIVGVCAGETTFALRCTAGAALGCGSDAIDVTVTANPSTYHAVTVTSTRSLGEDVTVSLNEHCKLLGTTAADCTATVGGTAGKESIVASTTIMLSGSDYNRYDVAITGGAEKTANPSAECKAPDTNTSGASTRAVAMWGLVGVVGVASLLGL